MLLTPIRRQGANLAQMSSIRSCSIESASRPETLILERHPVVTRIGATVLLRSREERDKILHHGQMRQELSADQKSEECRVFATAFAT